MIPPRNYRLFVLLLLSACQNTGAWVCHFSEKPLSSAVVTGMAVSGQTNTMIYGTFKRDFDFYEDEYDNESFVGEGFSSSPYELRQQQKQQQFENLVSSGRLDTKYVGDRRERRRITLEAGKQAGILSRTVPITNSWNITVWEWEKPAAVVETYWQVQQQGLSLTPSTTFSARKQNLLDPFGLVLWPGAVIAAQEMFRVADVVDGQRVLILGAGVGIEAQAAAMLGAESVLATDIHPTTLRLLQYGAEQAGLSDVISTAILDIESLDELPPCDLMVIADVLYNEKLATQIALRCLEARRMNPNVAILIADSQRFVKDFDVRLNEYLSNIGEPRVQWSSRWLPTFTGSGVLLDTDQTYDVKARIMWIGLYE